MKLEVLISSLDNPQPAVRLDVARVLGMLDEVRALDALRQRFQVETDPAVKSAIAWAGKRLFEAQQASYSTVDEICRHFGVDREIEYMPDAKEAEMLKKLQDNFDSEMIRMQDQTNKKKAGMALAAGLGGAMVGGMTMGMAAAMGSMSGTIGAPSSNLEARPQIGTKRNPATMPSKSDISLWAKRLREATSADVRENAAIELAQLNNPMALPHLAAAFVNDPEVKVRQAAQRFGKVLYWSMLYWEMEQDGSLAEEMKRRAEKIGKSIDAKATDAANAPTEVGSGPADAPFTAPQRPAEAPQEDIGEILRRAKEGRAKRLGGK